MTTYYPFGSGTYALGTSIGSTDTSILLSSFADPQTGVAYTMAILNTSIAFGTIAPKTTQSEFISFTGITQNANGTAVLTGVTRGLQKYYPFTANSAYQLPHSGQSVFIISNPPQLYEEFATKNNNEVIPGNWDFTGNVTFANFPVTPSNSNASSTVIGVTKLSIDPATPTNPIAVGSNDTRVPTQYEVGTSGTDDYQITTTFPYTIVSPGQIVVFKADVANTGAATLQINALGVKTIKKNSSGGLVDLVTGDIFANQIVTVVYDGTYFQLGSPDTVNLANAAGVLPTVNGGTGNSVYTFRSGTTIKDTSDASTTQTIAHGLGYSPIKVRINAICTINGGGNYNYTDVSNVISDPSGTHCNYVWAIDGANGGGISTTFILNPGTAGGGYYQSGVITADATNIYITWTRINNPVGIFQLLWEAN